MAERNAVVGINDTHLSAEQGIKALHDGGFDMKKLSIVGRGYHKEERVVGFYTAGGRVKFWAGQGALWGGLWGLLVGAGFFLIPGIGPLLVFGPIVTWLVAALESAALVAGLSALGAALYSLGIPKDSILQYEAALKSDRYLVMAWGTAEEADLARGIIVMRGAAAIDAYPGINTGTKSE
jgi:hypothetical protein